jgi:hypothetical protein
MTRLPTWPGGSKSLKGAAMPVRPQVGSFVIVTRGFAAGLVALVEAPRGTQAAQTNKVPVRLCGPGERVWMINWRSLRPATFGESCRWGCETYADHVARMNGGQDGLEAD